MSEEIVIAESDGAERDEVGELVQGIAIDATEVGITAEYIHLDTEPGEVPAGSVSVNWDDIIKYAPSDVLHAEIYHRKMFHDLGGRTSRQAPEQLQMFPEEGAGK